MLKTSRDEGEQQENIFAHAAISSIFCINFFHPSSFSQTTMVAAVQGFDFFAKRCLKKQPWLCALPILRYFPRQRLFVCLKIPLTRVSCKKGIKSSFSQISVFHYRQYWEMIKMLNRRYLMNFHHSGSVQINRWRRGHILPVEEKNHISIEEVEDFLKFLDIPLSFMIS